MGRPHRWGAFNVLHGNHALNLEANYGLRSDVNPFLTLTADHRESASSSV